VKSSAEKPDKDKNTKMEQMLFKELDGSSAVLVSSLEESAVIKSAANGYSPGDQV